MLASMQMKLSPETHTHHNTKLHRAKSRFKFLLFGLMKAYHKVSDDEGIESQLEEVVLMDIKLPYTRS